MTAMKKLFQKLFAKKQEDKPLPNKSNEVQTTQMKEKKEAAFHQVGKRYGRAITRLSDT